MDRLLAVPDRTNAVLHTLALAATSGGMLSAGAAAERLGVSASYLSKALQTLSRAGILDSSRGAGGGFELARAPESITCLEILELLEGPVPDRECLFPVAVCDTRGCALAVLCRETTKRIVEVFGRTTIADLARSFGGRDDGAMPRTAIA